MSKFISDSTKIILFGYLVGMCDLFANLICYIPSHTIRISLLSYLFNIEIGKDSTIHMIVKFSGCVPKFLQKYNEQIGFLSIGKNCSIGDHCFLDLRGKIIIGNNVSISPYVFILTADHDPRDIYFVYRKKQVAIEDYVWVATHSKILPGVTIHQGAVVGAGSTVTKDVEQYSIVAGSPIRKIGIRPHDLSYSINYKGFLK
jgi:acetyltransferase-like isoleucine patch superfamily enzyme